jgi:hypothetical protein
VPAFTDSFLQGESFRVDDAARWVEGNYDLGLFASSWDRRSICIRAAEGLFCNSALALFFGHRDACGLRDLHDPLLRDYLAAHSGEVREIAGQSIDTEALWERLRVEVLSVVAGHHRPLRIFIDLTSMPRFYSLGFIGLCISSGFTDHMTIVYSEGVYPEREAAKSVGEAFQFTSGRWKTVTVPFLAYSVEPALKKYFFISVGFEGSKVLRVVMRDDPDRVSIIFPEPGFRTDYVALAREANCDLVERMLVPDSQIVKACAGDAIEAWSAISAAGLERYDAENVFYLCCGTKPHSLALALRVLARRQGVVYYNVPEQYNLVDVRPSGVYWRYEIRDYSAF